jgi:hypothetical protein
MPSVTDPHFEACYLAHIRVRVAANLGRDQWQSTSEDGNSYRRSAVLRLHDLCVPKTQTRR